MNRFNSFLAMAASALMLMSMTSFAQDAEKACCKKDSTVTESRPRYEINRLFDNVFVGVAGGLNISETRNDSRGAASGRLAPNLNVYVGKWFTPDFGLRFGYNGLQARGWDVGAGQFTTPYENYYKEKYGFAYVHGDVMWNMFNTFCGYNPNRIWNMAPYFSAGWLATYGNKTMGNELAVGVGLYNQFRVHERVDITLDAHQMIAHNRFTGSRTLEGPAGITSISVGVAVRLGKVTSFKKVEEPDYDPYICQIDELEEEKTELNENNDALKAENEALKAKIKEMEENPKVVKEFPQLTPAAVFFEIGKTKADSRQLFNLEFFVKNVIEQNPDKVFTITGYADKQTGSAKRNQQLSEQRVEYIKNIMITKYNIPEDRLVIKSVGSSENRFDSPELNRCVVIE